jgi:hypothetical protein
MALRNLEVHHGILRFFVEKITLDSFVEMFEDSIQGGFCPSVTTNILRLESAPFLRSGCDYRTSYMDGNSLLDCKSNRF